MFWRLSAISLSLVAVDVGARTQSGGALAHLDYLPASASLPLSPVRRPWPTTVKGGTGGDNENLGPERTLLGRSCQLDSPDKTSRYPRTKDHCSQVRLE